MKKTIVLILTFILLFTSSIVMADAEPAINVSKTVVKPGESTKVTISMENNPGIVTMRLHVNYDNSVMELTGIEDHGLLPGKMHNESDFRIFPYCIYWDNGSASSNYIVDGDLITLTFSVKKDAPEGEYPIAVSYNNDDWDIFNYDFETVDFEVNSGSVTISNTIKPQINVSNVNAANGKTTFDLALTPQDEYNGVIVVATYENNKSKLCNVGTIYDISANMTNLEILNKGGTLLQIMWWNDFNTFTPIAKAVTINLE